MRKVIISLLTILLLINLPVACAQNNTSKETSSETIESTDNTNFLFNSNRLITENQTIFMDLIKDNPIDKAYLSATNDGTTYGMVKIEVDFAEIWKEELKYSCEKFTDLLNENDKTTFYSIQKDWENDITNNYMFLNDIFNNDEYQAYMGELFSVECASEYRNAIRQRTLYIKYLRFCLTSNKFNDKELSVEFVWQNKE